MKTPVHQWSYVFFSIDANTKYPCALFTYTCTLSLFVFRVRNVYLRVLRITFACHMDYNRQLRQSRSHRIDQLKTSCTHTFLYLYQVFYILRPKRYNAPTHIRVSVVVPSFCLYFIFYRVLPEFITFRDVKGASTAAIR